MKNLLLAAAGCLTLGAYLMSCNNNGTANYTAKQPNSGDYRSIAMQDARTIKATGKIFVRGNDIYVNEPYQGIHIIDNTDPTNPKAKAFLSVPGNVDMAMKDDILFIDNYDDLVAYNMKTKEESRVKGVFKGIRGGDGSRIAFEGAGSDPLGMNRAAFNAVQHGGASSGGGSSEGGPGVGGSMSRFAVVGNHLYVIDGNEMRVFDIERPYSPKQVSTVKMDFVVETIFPFEDKLFIGGTQGMYIYDNSDPANPTFISKVEHIVSCDPVVVEGNVAYVTLRGGTPCNNNANNELMLVDLKDIKNPQTIKNYPLFNPHGLAVEGNMLYVCDGKQGLKVFDVSNANDVKPLFANRDIATYDVIPQPHTLIVVGKDGLYQFDRSNPSDLKMMSKVAVERTI